MTVQINRLALALIVVALLVVAGALAFMAIDNAGTDTAGEALYDNAVEETEGLIPCDEVESPADLNEDGECLEP